MGRKKKREEETRERRMKERKGEGRKTMGRVVKEGAGERERSYNCTISVELWSGNIRENSR